MQPARISSRTILGAVFLAGVSAGVHCSLEPIDGLRGRSSAQTDTTDVVADGGTPTAEQAKALFTALQGDLGRSCGGSCHEAGQNGSPAWLKGPDGYATIKAYPGIVTAAASSSSLLTKGQHEGPPLTADLAHRVAAWLAVEAARLAATPALATPEIAIPAGAGTLSLPDGLGTITFSASLTGGILELRALTLVATSTTGVHAAGIRIVLAKADGTVRVDQSLASADVTAPRGESVPLDVGLVLIPQVSADERLHLAFDKLEASTAPATDAGPGTTGGCKDLASFTTNAAPALRSGTCLNCHDTGGTGYGALDLSALSTSPPDLAAACAQARNEIDTTTPAASPIVRAPTGGLAGHPFQGAPTSFVTALTTWITAEK